jgi:hypothetical protein
MKRLAAGILALCLLTAPLAARRKAAPASAGPVSASAAVGLSASAQADRARLAKEVEDLRWRLREDGQEESLRGRPNWWDLPSRTRQQERLRALRELRLRLEAELARLNALDAGAAPKTAHQ